MVVGTLSLVKKGQTSGFSGCSHTVDTVHSGCTGCSTQWTHHHVPLFHCINCVHCILNPLFDFFAQYTVNTVDTVPSGCSGIEVYGSGDIVFDQKGQTSGCSMQYTVDAVE